MVVIIVGRAFLRFGGEKGGGGEGESTSNGRERLHYCKKSGNGGKSSLSPKVQKRGGGKKKDISYSSGKKGGRVKSVEGGGCGPKKGEERRLNPEDIRLSVKRVGLRSTYDGKEKREKGVLRI